MVDEPQSDDIDLMLDEQLEQIEKSEKRKNIFYKKLILKRGMIIVAVILLMAVAGIISLVAGINNAVDKNQAIIAEAKQEANKRPINRMAASDSKSSSSKVTLVEELQRKTLIEKREDSNENQRLSDAKSSNHSVIAKLDELKGKAVNKIMPRRRFSKNNQKTIHQNLDLNLQALFKSEFDLPSTNKGEQNNFEWLVAANTGGQNGAKLKASIEYHEKDLSSLLGKERPPETLNPGITTNPNHTIDALAYPKEPIADARAFNQPAKLGIRRVVTQEETAMLLMQIDSSKESPVTARIMDSRSDLDGAKLACEFKLTQDQLAVQIKCNKLVFQDHSYNINIIMLDPATRNSNIVDRVDTHWWKWLAFSAATFAEGYLNFATTKTTVINTDGSQTTQSAAIENAGDRNRAALAHIGKTAIAGGDSILNIANQVYVDEYRPVILLYLDDLTI